MVNSKRNHQNDDEDLPLPKLSTVKKLEELATAKLAEIVRNYGAGKKGWTGYDEAEVIAARELLDRDVDNRK
jgi:CRISPR/Cas system CMR subunit Cmr6 (Cas7 group RAMP superfamily)